jgi:hypothetical protein
VEHQLGRINIVAWQDRRVHVPHHADILSVVLVIAMVASALLLCLRFAFGTPLPLELLQVAFAALAASSALMLTRGMVRFILWLQRF